MTRPPPLSWIDISVPVGVDGPLPSWPGSPRPRFEPRLRLADGDPADDTNLSCSLHTGTHIDAPSHFVPGGKTVDQLDLAAMNGPCFVANCEGVARIEPDTLERAAIPAGTTRLLLKTDNAAKWGPDFDESFVGLGLDGARWLAERGVRLVGIDYLSVQPYGDTDEIHRTLLAAEIVLLEGLNLSAADAGRYVLMCLPMRLAGVEGAPARALLLPADSPLELA